jgi:hypothetical protein
MSDQRSTKEAPVEFRLKMQQRPPSDPADTTTTPVESCPACATSYSDEGSFIGGFSTGTATNYHCWCRRCELTCDITPGEPEGPPASGEALDAVALEQTPARLCPSCGRAFSETGGRVAKRLVEDLQTAYHCRCSACSFEGSITPVNRVLAHEAAD